MPGVWDAPDPRLLLWDGNLLDAIPGKLSFKVFALKWVNCFLLATLQLPARMGHLPLLLSFPGKELVIHRCAAASWCAQPGPGVEWT